MKSYAVVPCACDASPCLACGDWGYSVSPLAAEVIPLPEDIAEQSEPGDLSPLLALCEAAAAIGRWRAAYYGEAEVQAPRTGRA